jgi:4-hydroxy-3-polyprenylbenzoate decarboxylase
LNILETSKLLQLLDSKGYLQIIDDELDVNLEIPHVAYVEIKKVNPKVLLFTNPIDKKLGIKYEIPVLMNLFGSNELIELFFQRTPDEIGKEIEKLLKMKPPSAFGEKVEFLKDLFSLKSVFPKRKSRDISKTHKEFHLDLERLPILKTWSGDGGKFITMGQVYAHSLNGEVSNVGMYRLQVYDKTHLGMHWQIHKDTSKFFKEYSDANKKMPVTVVVGGDPLYTWVATAPMPYGVNELLLYGFVKKRNAQLIESNTNFVPEDGDIIINGLVDVDKLQVEGPFGDHTGYYTLEEEYPEMEVTDIWVKENPIYYATVVGKPPIEDKYMGWATERIFLPLLQTTAPDLIDYSMPENGVFHNLILGKMRVQYKGHAQQFMHAFWGVGQMSFVKHAIFVDENAPHLESPKEIIPYILNRISEDRLLISTGILDALDHSSSEKLVGGKLGIDATGDEVKLPRLNPIPDDFLLKKLRVACNGCAVHITGVKTYFPETQNPITVISVNKKCGLREKLPILGDYREFIRILVIVDDENNSIENPYMLLWRVVNNIDAKRDIYIDRNFYAIDATNKNRELDENFSREWPDDVVCDRDVIEDLQKRGVINVGQNFIDHFGIL